MIYEINEWHEQLSDSKIIEHVHVCKFHRCPFIFTRVVLFYNGTNIQNNPHDNKQSLSKKNNKKINSQRPLLFSYETIFKNQAQHQTEKGDRLKRGQVTGYRLQITEAPSYNKSSNLEILQDNIKALAGGSLENFAPPHPVQLPQKTIFKRH